MDNSVAQFERYRVRLFGIAYRMLGDVQHAEDVVQEVYLRWHGADHSAIDKPEAWLATAASRISIDWLRRAATDRTTYVGSWLPEPIAADEAYGMDRTAELASDLSMAFLVLLERLGPEERAAFLLREVFDTTYDEIALILEKSEAATRQIVHRARARVRSDSGGKVRAARNVLRGSDRIVRLLLGLARKFSGAMTYELAHLNGESAVITYANNRIFAATARS